MSADWGKSYPKSCNRRIQFPDSSLRYLVLASYTHMEMEGELNQTGCMSIILFV